MSCFATPFFNQVLLRATLFLLALGICAPARADNCSGLTDCWQNMAMAAIAVGETENGGALIVVRIVLSSGFDPAEATRTNSNYFGGSCR